ncbi:WD repeat-containing protein 53 isoform X1 [Synchiropus splendidus]|uniref:WD repeat-containing protein 53 isoform X1 n=1 Tax=Synchiropus splendidus TaxID=270530 RepID=UPI00237E1A6D|nr:WD repeat-containing protein 53 isoform X1 [Synchiropus splendidus]
MAGVRWCGAHSSSVLCVGESPHSDGLLASGGEGGEVALWSQEGSIVGHLTLSSEEDVTSVAFSPAAPALLFMAHGDSVSVLDPRNLKTVVEDFKHVGEEEINSVAVSESGSSLAVADDSGAVRVLELPGGKVCRTLRRHTNICSSVTFRPQRPNNIVSAGLDMQVMLWGLQKTRPLWTLSLQDVAEEEDDQQQQRPGQLFNPPLAHCVSVSSCGNVVGCAAEDGRVHLMRIGSGSKLGQLGAIKAHSQGASQAHFLSFLSHPYWLATGGNDGQVSLWDVSKHPVVTPGGKSKGQGSGGQRKKGKAKSRDKATTSQTEAEEAAAETLNFSTPKMTFSHGDKINWLSPALLKGNASLVVADQSDSLTVYPLTGL